MGTLLSETQDQPRGVSPLWAALVAWLKARDTRTLFVSEPELDFCPARELTTQRIICGNCAGEEDHPRKTLLSTAGNCAKCGGRSYALASKLFQPSRKE